MHPDGLAAAKACQLPGCCIFCEEPLGRIHGMRGPRYMCRSRDCWRAYFRAHHRDHPEHRRNETRRKVRKGETFWHCPCGTVTRRSGWGTHKLHCAQVSAAWPEVIIGQRAHASLRNAAPDSLAATTGSEDAA